MTEVASTYARQLTEWVTHLSTRRESLLNTWRTVCQTDQRLATQSSFSREEFNNQMPLLLDIFAQRLLGEKPKSDPIERAGHHGLLRWQRGYTLSELLNELAYFYKVLLDEFQDYVELHPHQHPDVLSLVYRQLYQISRDSYQGSILYYDRLREINAAQQSANLQQALDQVNDLVQLRDQHLQMSAHDLRSGFSILMGIMGATKLLEMPGTEQERAALFEKLNLNLSTIRDILLQLTDFARLEANQEELEIESFDVAVLLHTLVAKTQPIATERHLVLKADGPARLPVKSDRHKLQRIVQYLLVNALTNTPDGSIYVSWAQENDTRWILSVQDTEPGLRDGLATQLKPLAEPTRVHPNEGSIAHLSQGLPTTSASIKASDPDNTHSHGLDLFIVKKFCELLKANMEIEASPGEGTLVRLRFLTDQSTFTTLVAAVKRPV